MSAGSHFARSQRMTIAAGILFLVVIITILQLWLMTASINAYLGGDTTVLWPAALASLACLGLNGGLYRYLLQLEVDPRPGAREGAVHGGSTAARGASVESP